VDSVALLGLDGKRTFRQQPDGLHIELPAQIPGNYAFAFRIVPASPVQ
jgi:alpha-L-fucosidase